jgi:YgiT-type zinc finger domain-containing protein
LICPICRCGYTRAGFASVTLERESTTLWFENVPAQVCDNCGEEFIDEPASANLLNTAEAAARDGVKVELWQLRCGLISLNANKS